VPQDQSGVSRTRPTASTATVAEDHFHPKGKRPSEHTLKIFEEARRALPFSDRQDFEEQDRDFIARPK